MTARRAGTRIGGAVARGVRPASRVRAVPAAAAVRSLWIALFFLLPLALMTWRSLTQRWLLAAIYARARDLAALHQGHADEPEDRDIDDGRRIRSLGYPIAYVLTISGGAARADFRSCVGDDPVLGRRHRPQLFLADRARRQRHLSTRRCWRSASSARRCRSSTISFSVLLAMIQILLPLTIITLFGAMLRIDRTLIAAAKIHGAQPMAGVSHRVLSAQPARACTARACWCSSWPRLLCHAGAARQPGARP